MILILNVVVGTNCMLMGVAADACVGDASNAVIWKIPPSQRLKDSATDQASPSPSPQARAFWKDI